MRLGDFFRKSPNPSGRQRVNESLNNSFHNAIDSNVSNERQTNNFLNEKSLEQKMRYAKTCRISFFNSPYL